MARKKLDTDNSKDAKNKKSTSSQKKGTKKTVDNKKVVNSKKKTSVKKTRTPKEVYEEKQAKKRKKKFMNGKFNLDILDLLILIVITAIVSCLLTGLILNKQYKRSGLLLDNSLSTDTNLQNFISTYEEIVKNYYEEVDKEGMIDAATNGMLSFLEDNYSIFLKDTDAESLSETLDGTYEGLGIVEVSNIVYSVYKDSPAEKAGIKAKDEIIKVNGNDINDKNYYRISEYLDSSKENEIVVKRDGKELIFKVSFGTIVVPSASSTIIKSKDASRNIGYIKLNTFSKMSFEEFEEELMKLEKDSNISSLIIDLRNNSGGYVTSAANIASLFLEKDSVIYSLESQDDFKTVKDETKESRKYDIVILVNGQSASAAEILTAALHDSYGAKVVGEKTYGKGKVQNVKSYENKIIKYTAAKWLRPNGDCVDGVGIEPDYVVSIDYKNGTFYDKQYDKALELLR